MHPNPLDDKTPALTLRPVGRDNWRAVYKLKVTPEQLAQDFVAEPGLYLANCAYGGLWHPLAIHLDEQVVGFLMWAIDPEDSSCWFGGFFLDQSQQGHGYGRQALQAAITMLKEQGHRHFALSYYPHNTVAKHLYSTFGFVETGERDGDEVVARLTLAE